MEAVNVKVDVVICTKNSEAVLDQCLESVERELPGNRVIIVDGGSTDKTLAISRKHRCEIYVKPELNLGQSRMFGFKKVRTEWFAQIDADEVLHEGWWKEMSKHLKEADVIECGRFSLYKIPYVPRKQRAMFGQDLIKRSIVDEVDEKRMNVIVNEDEIFRRLIEARGFKWLQLPKILADHYSMYYTVPARDPNVKLEVKQKNVPAWATFEEGYKDAITHVKSKFWLRVGASFYCSLILLFKMVGKAWTYRKGYKKGSKLR